MKRYAVMTVVTLLALLALSGLTLTSRSIVPSGDSAKPRAAIIDQLYSLEPHPALIAQLTKSLEDYGFSVSLHQGEEVTVDFYRQLPQRGYQLLVFRAHLGILTHVYGDRVVPQRSTALFSGEAYTTAKHTSEQLAERVQRAQMADGTEVFSVNSDFLLRSMEGTFDHAVVLMMGCSSYYYDDLAAAFVQKGAAAYLGWSASVLLDYLDRATLTLVTRLSTEDASLEQAVSRTMTAVGRDPRYNATLRYYPAPGGTKTLRELTGAPLLARSSPR